MTTPAQQKGSIFLLLSLSSCWMMTMIMVKISTNFVVIADAWIPTIHNTARISRNHFIARQRSINTILTRIQNGGRNNYDNNNNNNNNRISSSSIESTSGLDNVNKANKNNGISTIVIVGGTGRIGQIIIKRLLDSSTSTTGPTKYTVRAIVRNITKAKELFSMYNIIDKTTSTIRSTTNTNTNINNQQHAQLELYEADIALCCNNDTMITIIDNCICDSNAIISTMGVIRFTKLTDFLPWNFIQLLFSSSNSNSTFLKKQPYHPYWGNYIGQKILLQLSTKYNLQCFIRITGLGIAYPITNSFVILFNLLLSLTMKWNLLFENILRSQQNNTGSTTNSNPPVPYYIIRPGGLADDERNVTTTNIQIDTSGILPFPGRIGRADVADLCIEAMKSNLDSTSTSTSSSSTSTNTNIGYTIACRWVDTNIKPKPQGTMKDGYSTAKECIDQLTLRTTSSNTNVQSDPVIPMRPYGLVVGITFYTLVALFLKVSWSLVSLIMKRYIYR